MTPPSRRESAEDARTRILAATADCLVRDGLARVRMAAIAKEAGVSSGLLHYHFDTKEQLFAAVLRYSSEVSNALTARALDRAGTDPAGRLSAFLDRCLPSDERLTRDWLLWQELDLLCMRQPELARVGAQVYDALYDGAADLVAAGVDAGVFDLPAGEVRTVAESAVALCDGLGARVLAPEDLTLEAARERVALAVGRLVGHRGPLPRPGRALQAARA